MNDSVRKFFRSKTHKIIAGVCGGIAEYYNVDPMLVRIIYLLLAIFTAVIPFVVLYLALWILFPER